MRCVKCVCVYLHLCFGLIVQVASFSSILPLLASLPAEVLMTPVKSHTKKKPKVTAAVIEGAAPAPAEAPLDDAQCSFLYNFLEDMVVAGAVEGDGSSGVCDCSAGAQKLSGMPLHTAFECAFFLLCKYTSPDVPALAHVAAVPVCASRLLTDVLVLCVFATHPRIHIGGSLFPCALAALTSGLVTVQGVLGKRAGANSGASLAAAFASVMEAVTTAAVACVQSGAHSEPADVTLSTSSGATVESVATGAGIVRVESAVVALCNAFATAPPPPVADCVGAIAASVGGVLCGDAPPPVCSACVSLLGRVLALTPSPLTAAFAPVVPSALAWHHRVFAGETNHTARHALLASMRKCVGNDTGALTAVLGDVLSWQALLVWSSCCTGIISVPVDDEVEEEEVKGGEAEVVLPTPPDAVVADVANNACCVTAFVSGPALPPGALDAWFSPLALLCAHQHISSDGSVAFLPLLRSLTIAGVVSSATAQAIVTWAARPFASATHPSLIPALTRALSVLELVLPLVPPASVDTLLMTLWMLSQYDLSTAPLQEAEAYQAFVDRCVSLTVGFQGWIVSV